MKLIKDPSEIWSSVNFKSSAIYLITKWPKRCFIFGQNAKHGNLSAFGGVALPNETMLQCTLREFAEETNDCFDLDAIKDSLQMKDGAAFHCEVLEKSPGRYISVIEIPGYISLSYLSEKFHSRRSLATEGYLENNDLVLLPLDHAFNEDSKIRDVCVDSAQFIAKRYFCDLSLGKLWGYAGDRAASCCCLHCGIVLYDIDEFKKYGPDIGKNSVFCLQCTLLLSKFITSEQEFIEFNKKMLADIDELIVGKPKKNPRWMFIE